MECLLTKLGTCAKFTASRFGGTFRGRVLETPRKAERPTKMIDVYFDGSCLPVNPGGTARAGAVVYQNGKRIAQLSRKIGSGPGMSNNVAEYAALYLALEYLIEKNLQNEKIKAYGDSQIVVNAVNRIKPSKGLCHDFSVKTIFLSRQFPNANFIWIPREQNTEADRLSNTAKGFRLSSPWRPLTPNQKYQSADRRDGYTVQADFFSGAAERSRVSYSEK